MADLIALADGHHDLFNKQDVRCLKKAGVHSKIVEAAAGDLSRDREEEAADAREAAEKAEARAEAEARRAKEREEALRNRYDIDIIAAVVGPATSSGSKWDGPGSIDPDVTKGALALVTGATGLATAGMGALTAYVSNQFIQGTAAPDVYGYAQFVGPDAPTLWSSLRLSLASPNAPVADNYYPTFSGGPGFHGVKFERGDVVRITLYDHDLSSDDPMGVVEITDQDVVAAAAGEGVFAVDVSGRTMNQILVVQISVRPAASTAPTISGPTFSR